MYVSRQLRCEIKVSLVVTMQIYSFHASFKEKQATVTYLKPHNHAADIPVTALGGSESEGFGCG